MQIPCYIKSYASAELPQNGNSEHYKQKHCLSVHRPEHSPSPECVCVCVCVCSNAGQKLPDNSKPRTVVCTQHWVWEAAHVTEWKWDEDSKLTANTRHDKLIRNPESSNRCRHASKCWVVFLRRCDQKILCRQKKWYCRWCCVVLMTKQRKWDTTRPTCSDYLPALDSDKLWTEETRTIMTNKYFTSDEFMPLWTCFPASLSPFLSPDTSQKLDRCRKISHYCVTLLHWWHTKHGRVSKSSVSMTRASSCPHIQHTVRTYQHEVTAAEVLNSLEIHINLMN